MIASLLVGLAQAGVVDDYASRPGWACSYNQNRTLCAGDDTLLDVASNHVVNICDDDICNESWRAELTGAERDAAAVAWAGYIQEEYRETAWTVQPANPGSWAAIMRTPDRSIVLELADDSVRVTVEPLPFCEMNRVMKNLHPYMLAVSGSFEADWPAIAATTLAQGIDEGAVSAAAASMKADPPVDAAQRLLLASEPFHCYRQTHRQKELMTVVRLAAADWEVWRNPTAKELRQRKKEEKQWAKENASSRDVDSRDVDDVPDEDLSDE